MVARHQMVLQEGYNTAQTLFSDRVSFTYWKSRMQQFLMTHFENWIAIETQFQPLINKLGDP